MKGKKGTISLYISMMIFAIVLVLIAAVVAPMGVLFNAELFSAGEDILLQSNASIQKITDTEVREGVTDTVDKAYDAAQYNMETNANFFRYSWIFVLVLGGIMVFLYARTLVEYTRPGGFV